MILAELWRYPAKSMAGERLALGTLGAAGVEGDRLLLVRGPRGRIVTARTKPGLLGLRGSTGPAGVPLINGMAWNDPQVAPLVEAAAGPGARLELAGDDEARFDILPLLVATDGALAAAGYDSRRFRPNLIIATGRAASCALARRSSRWPTCAAAA